MNLGQNKKKKVAEFTSTDAPSTTAVSLTQTNLQISENNVKMVETGRSPCNLNINLKDYNKTDRKSVV